MLSEVFCVPVAPRRCLERFQGGIGNAFGVSVGSQSWSLGSPGNVSGGSFGAPGGGLGVPKGVLGVSGVALWGVLGSLEAFRRGFWEAPQVFGRSLGGFLSAWYSRLCAPECLPDSN